MGPRGAQLEACQALCSDVRASRRFLMSERLVAWQWSRLPTQHRALRKRLEARSLQESQNLSSCGVLSVGQRTSSLVLSLQKTSSSCPQQTAKRISILQRRCLASHKPRAGLNRSQQETPWSSA